MQSFPDRFPTESFAERGVWAANRAWAYPYVYLHVDDNGVPFFVRHGARDDAWDVPDDHLWTYHVRENLGGCMHVVLLQTGMTQELARELKDAVLQRYHAVLLNSSNPWRPHDSNGLSRYHAINDQIRPFYELPARYKAEGDFSKMESTCRQAIALCRQLETSATETGLFGQLLRQTGSQRSNWPFFLEPLTEQLLVEGRAEEARQELAEYLAAHPYMKDEPRLVRIAKRCARGAYSRRPRKSTQPD